MVLANQPLKLAQVLSNSLSEDYRGTAFLVYAALPHTLKMRASPEFSDGF